MNAQCKTVRVQLVELSETAQVYLRRAINQAQVAYKHFREVALKYPGVSAEVLFEKCPLVFTSPQWIIPTSTLQILANRAKSHPEKEMPTRFVGGNVLGMPISKNCVETDWSRCRLHFADCIFVCRYLRGSTFDFLPKLYGIEHKQFAFGDLSMEINKHGQDLFYLSLVYKFPQGRLALPLCFPRKGTRNHRTCLGL